MSISNLFYTTNEYKLHANSLEIDNQFYPNDNALTVNGATLFNGSVTFSQTSNATSETTGSLIVAGGAGIEKDLYVGGTLTASNIIYKVSEIVTNTENSTSTSTGALQVAGGAGIAKNVYIGGNNVVSGNSTVYGNGVVSGSLFVGGNINGNLKTSTIDSSSPTTGALTVAGGLGVAKSIYCNSINGSSLYLSDATVSSDTSTGALQVIGGIATGNNINIGGNCSIGGVLNTRSCIVNSTNNATDTMSGSVVIRGGASVAGDFYVGGSIIENNPRALYLPSSDWFLLYTMTTSQNLNILARSETNQITELLINGSAISSNLNNYIMGSMPRFLVYQTGSTYDVFISSGADTSLNVLNTDTPLIKSNYGAGSYPNGRLGDYIYDTNSITGFSTSDIFYLYNTASSISSDTGSLIVEGGIGCGNIFTGASGISIGNADGSQYTTLYQGASGLVVAPSTSAIVFTSNNAQVKVQRSDDLDVVTLSNAPVYSYGGIASLNKIGCIEGLYVNNGSSSSHFSSFTDNYGTSNAEFSSTNGGVNFRNPPAYSFFVSGNQRNADFTRSDRGAVCTVTGDVTNSNNYLWLNAGGATLSQVKYNSRNLVDVGQAGTVQFWFKTSASYANPPTSSVYIMELMGASSGHCALYLYHFTTGYLKLWGNDEDGTKIFDVNLTSFTPVAGTPYFFSVDWDFTTGDTQVFLNGSQIGSTNTNTYSRVDGGQASAYIISNSNSTSASYGLSMIEMYTSKQHTTSYIPPPITNYNLVSFPSTGGLKIFADTTNQVSGIITCDSSTGNLYWNGSSLPGQFIPSQQIHITNTTGSSSVTTGALIVDGGVGIVEKVNIGSTVASSDTSTGAVVVAGGLGIGKASHMGDSLTIHNSVTSGLVSQLLTNTSGIMEMNVNSGVNINTAITYSWFGSFLTSTTADYSRVGASLVPTIGTTGSASIVSGKLQVTAGCFIYWATTGTGTVDPGSTGCVNFKYTPAYAGYPTATATLFQLVNSSGNANKLQIYHMSSGSLKVGIYDNSGTLIFDTTLLSTWLNGASANVEYEMELNWSPTATRMFVNGTQLGATITTDISSRTGTCSRINIMSASGGSTFSIRQMQLFNTVQHTTTYTPFQPIGGNMLTLNPTNAVFSGNVYVNNILNGNYLPYVSYRMGNISSNSNTNVYFSLNPNITSITDSMLFNHAYPSVHAYGRGIFGNLLNAVATLKLQMIIDSTTYVFFESAVTAPDAITQSVSLLDILYKIIPVTSSTFDVYICGTTTFSDTGGSGVNAYNAKQRPIYLFANNGGSHYTRGSSYTFDANYKYDTASTSNYITVITARQEVLNVY